MPESAEACTIVSKHDYEAAIPQMRTDLVNAQYDLQSADFSVLINLLGDDRQGCEEIVDLFPEWMDGRFIDSHFFDDPSGEEGERPSFWRYWRALPRKGRIGLFINEVAWHELGARISDVLDEKSFDAHLEHVRKFYEALAADGTLVLNLWIHLPKKERKKRLKKARKNPTESWQVQGVDWEILAGLDEAVPVFEEAMRRTTTDDCTWHIVDGTNNRYRNLTVARTVLDAITDRLAREPAVAETESVDSPGRAPATDLRREALSSVDLSLALEKDEYKKRLNRYQRKLNKLSLRARKAGVSTVLVFEGWDAAGKGGVIRRITSAISARDVRVVSIAAPTDEELAHHYLWRFWRHLPRMGRMLIFDRSWYGRVLVERIEGFASRDEWSRAYDEIVEFESQLTEHGMCVRKFWLHIDADEQQARFEAREQTSYKKYKITDEDYRNREKWDDYVVAVGEMVARTSTDQAPWILVPANNKRWARVAVLKELCKGLEALLDD